MSDLNSLSNVLKKLENEPTHTIIRGSLVDGQAGTVHRNKKTFAAMPPSIDAVYEPDLRLGFESRQPAASACLGQT